MPRKKPKPEKRTKPIPSGMVVATPNSTLKEAKNAALKLSSPSANVSDLGSRSPTISLASSRQSSSRSLTSNASMRSLNSPFLTSPTINSRSLNASNLSLNTPPPRPLLTPPSTTKRDNSLEDLIRYGSKIQSIDPQSVTSLTKLRGVLEICQMVIRDLTPLASANSSSPPSPPAPPPEPVPKATSVASSQTDAPTPPVRMPTRNRRTQTDLKQPPPEEERGENRCFRPPHNTSTALANNLTRLAPFFADCVQPPPQPSPHAPFPQVEVHGGV